MPPDITGTFACGLTTGLIQAAVFNPYDRAMYLSIQLNRPFLSSANWALRESFVGVLPSVLQRAVSSGLYFPLEQVARIRLRSAFDNHGKVDALAGVISGAATGFITAPINAAKFDQWRQASSKSAADSARSVYREGGIRGLMRAAPVTVVRDVSFGITFSYLRHRNDSGLIENITAALIATVISSPFNYVRLRQYAAFGVLQQPTALTILKDVARDIRLMPTLTDRLRCTFRVFNIGWGALRVGLGMGISSQIFDVCTRNYT